MDTCEAMVVQDFDAVTVEDGDTLAGEVVCQVWTRESRCPVGGIHSFTLWPPLPRKLLRLEELVRGHPYGERIPQHDPSLYAARGSQLVPHIGLDKVLLHAVATLVQEAKFSLR